MKKPLNNWGLSCLIFASAIMGLAACNSRQQVDLIIHNGKVYTVDSSFSIKEAFAIKDGKIVATGTNKEILGTYAGKETFNAGGKYIYPGFIDAHAHFLGYGRGQYEVNLYGCTNWDEAVDRVQKFVADHPDIQWIKGRGWDQNLFPGKRYPDNSELNALFPDKGILLQRVDGHAAIANDFALKLAHIDHTTKLTGGRVELDHDIPTGLLIDNAVELVKQVIPTPSAADYSKWLSRAEQDCYEEGVTTVTDCGLPFPEIEMIDSLQRAGTLNMRIYAMLSDDGHTYKQYMSKRAKRLQQGGAYKANYIGNGPYKTEKLIVCAVKAYADGALGSRGACLLEPYHDMPTWNGFLLSTPEHFDSLAAMLIGTDMQLCTHAIGDSGNRTVLSIYARYLKPGNDRRWRIEHAQVVHPADIPMFGKYAIVPSVQPTHATSDMAWAVDRLGAERVKTAYAYRNLLAQNGWIPLGTDFPVEEISPLNTFQSAVYRQNAQNEPAGGFQPENALTPQETLKGMTIWAAKSCFLEKEVGSIEVGKAADFVILNNDIMTTKSAKIPKTTVQHTYVSGTKVY